MANIQDKYVETILIKPELDKKQIKDIQSEFDKLHINELVSDKTKQQFKQQYVDMKTNLEKIKLLKQTISEIKMFSGDSAKQGLNEMQKELTNLQRKQKQYEMQEVGNNIRDALKPDGELGSKIQDAFKKLASKIGDFFKSMFKDALNTITEMASYDLQNSLFMNTEAREQALTYGLSNAQNYALSQVKEEMGISSDEDLMWMNDAQQEKFAERIGYYTDKYDTLNQSGFFKTWQDFQYSWKEFKTEFAMEIATFFVENKDTIKSTLKALMEVLKGLTKVIEFIVKQFGGSNERTATEKAAATMDIINNYSGSTYDNNNSKNTNIKIDNTFNNVAKTDQTWLSNAGQMTYQQIIEAMK